MNVIPTSCGSATGYSISRIPSVSSLRFVREARGTRPYLELERSGHFLAEHLYQGITVQQAQEIAEYAVHNG